MKKEDANKKGTTVTGRLKLLTLLSVLAMAVLLCIVSVCLSLSQIKSDYRSYAEVSTIHLRDALENGKDGWIYDADTGKLYCNENEVSVELFNTINEEDAKVYHTFFLDDTRIVTNIKTAAASTCLVQRLTRLFMIR